MITVHQSKYVSIASWCYKWNSDRN